MRPGLQFFGISLSQSSLDQSKDSLPDIAVGSMGAVLLLRFVKRTQNIYKYRVSAIITHICVILYVNHLGPEPSCS